MTKKSDLRLMRDAQKQESKRLARAPQNTAWTDLNERYNECIRLLLAHTGISIFSQCQVLLAELDDKMGFASSARAMANDIRSLRAKLGVVLEMHRGRHGSATPDEIQYTIEVNEEYMKWIALHAGSVMPLAQDLTTEILAAELKLNHKGVYLMIDGDKIVHGTQEEIAALVARRNAGDFGPAVLSEAQTLHPTADLAAKTNHSEVTDVAVN